MFTASPASSSSLVRSTQNNNSSPPHLRQARLPGSYWVTHPVAFEDCCRCRVRVSIPPTDVSMCPDSRTTVAELWPTLLLVPPQRTTVLVSVCRLLPAGCSSQVDRQLDVSLRQTEIERERKKEGGEAMMRIANHPWGQCLRPHPKDRQCSCLLSPQ